MDIKKPRLSLISTKEDGVATIGVAKNKTLRELLEDQLKEMSKEDGDLEVYDALLVMETNDGLAHINMTPTSIYRCIGMLEVMKAHIGSMLYDDEDY